jgi:hypothetical protein
LEDIKMQHPILLEMEDLLHDVRLHLARRPSGERYSS